MHAMPSFAVLADPTRRRIVELLATGDMGAGEIHGNFRMTGPAVSQHLKVLRDAHLVRVKVDAQRRVYSLDPRGLDELEEWLLGIRTFWSQRLDALERALVAEKAVAEKAVTEPTKKKRKP